MNNKLFNIPWGMDWADLQSQQLGSYNSFFPNTSPTNPFSQNPWSNSMDYWWKTNSPSLPSDQFDVLNNILTQGKSLYFLGDQLVQFLDNVSTQKHITDSWQESLDQQIDLMKENFLSDTSFFDNSIMSELQTAQVALQSMVNALPGFPDLPKGNISDKDLNEYIDKYLSMPGLGLNRELQEKIQKSLLSYKHYQDVNEEYKKAMAEVAVNGLDIFKDKLSKLADNRESIESLRQLYDLWVDSNEDSYGEYTLSEDYSKLYGKLVNSMMAYKKNNAELMEELHSAYNIPSKKDFDDLIKVQYLLKHKFRDGEQESDKERRRISALEQQKQREIKRIDALEQEKRKELKRIDKLDKERRKELERIEKLEKAKLKELDRLDVLEKEKRQELKRIDRLEKEKYKEHDRIDALEQELKILREEMKTAARSETAAKPKKKTSKTKTKSTVSKKKKVAKKKTAKKKSVAARKKQSLPDENIIEIKF